MSAPDPARPTRFARLYPDGSVTVLSAKHDFTSARAELANSSDDDDTELLEVRLEVIRTHGKPKLRAVSLYVGCCPTCGELVSMEATDAG
jgi:hypothetical protein